MEAEKREQRLEAERKENEKRQGRAKSGKGAGRHQEYERSSASGGADSLTGAREATPATPAIQKQVVASTSPLAAGIQPLAKEPGNVALPLSKPSFVGQLSADDAHLYAALSVHARAGAVGGPAGAAAASGLARSSSAPSQPPTQALQVQPLGLLNLLQQQLAQAEQVASGVPPAKLSVRTGSPTPPSLPSAHAAVNVPIVVQVQGELAGLQNGREVGREPAAGGAVRSGPFTAGLTAQEAATGAASIPAAVSAPEAAGEISLGSSSPSALLSPPSILSSPLSSELKRKRLMRIMKRVQQLQLRQEDRRSAGCIEALIQRASSAGAGAGAGSSSSGMRGRLAAAAATAPGGAVSTGSAVVVTSPRRSSPLSSPPPPPVTTAPTFADAAADAAAAATAVSAAGASPADDGSARIYRIFRWYTITTRILDDMVLSNAVLEGGPPYSRPVFVRNDFRPSLPPEALNALRYGLTEEAQAVLQEQNAGGNSENSEAISVEVRRERGQGAARLQMEQRVMPVFHLPPAIIILSSSSLSPSPSSPTDDAHGAGGQPLCLRAAGAVLRARSYRGLPCPAAAQAAEAAQG